MNNNSIRIDQYLQNEMNEEERRSFEAELAADSTLREELNIQQLITEAAYREGLKASFAAAIHKRMVRGKWIRRGTFIVVTVSVILLVFNTNIFHRRSSAEKKPDSSSSVINNSTPFINPPMAGIDIPFQHYSIDAEKGKTLFMPTGSVVYFPPSAFTDEAGNIVKGTVQVDYREFKDPADFFVSGIPMQYDSAGTGYQFESAGMCEINAYVGEKRLSVNQQAAPQVYLSSSDKRTAHNLYYLDKENRKWKFAGKDLVRVVKDQSQKSVSSPKQAPAVAVLNTETTVPQKPVRPLKASDDHQSFSLEIDPDSFEELAAYDKLKFEVVDDKNYNRADADEHWQTVKLNHTEVSGIYYIVFTNQRRTVSYRVRPVLDGADYDAAMKVFTEKNKEYEAALNKRLNRETALKDSAIAFNNKMIAAAKENDSLNALIMQRNKVLREEYERRKKAILAEQKQEEERRKQAEKDALRKMDEMDRQNAAARAEAEAREAYQRQLAETAERIFKDEMANGAIIRSFAINRFGIWNCDNPVYRQTITIFAKFTDDTGKEMDIPTAAVIYRGFNGLAQFTPQNFCINTRVRNMIWFVKDLHFYYFTYEDFDNAKINDKITAFTFRMRKAATPISSFEDIRAIIKDL